MKNHPLVVTGLVLLLIAFINSAWFIVVQTEQAIVLQFGNLSHVVTEPALHSNGRDI